MATRRTTLEGMLGENDIRPTDAVSVTTSPALVDITAQVATLEALDPQNPALPQLRRAAAQGDVAGARGLLGALAPAGSRGVWLLTLLAIAGLVAAYWWSETRKKKQPARRRQNRVPDFLLDDDSAADDREDEEDDE